MGRKSLKSGDQRLRSWTYHPCTCANVSGTYFLTQILSKYKSLSEAILQQRGLNRRAEEGLNVGK